MKDYIRIFIFSVVSLTLFAIAVLCTIFMINNVELKNYLYVICYLTGLIISFSGFISFFVSYKIFKQ